MNSQQKGAYFEKITKGFFVWIFEKIGFSISKERVQFSGNQNGFDVELIVSKNFIEHRIFIECKNYESDLAIGNILKKAWDLEKNYKLTSDDLFIAINPKSNFKNEDNSEKSSPILAQKFDFEYYQLDVSNGIKNLFALNKEFYKELYGTEVEFQVDEDKEVKRIDNLIHSRNPFRKVILKSEDREKFIGNITISPDTLERSYIENNESELFFLHHETLSISEILTKGDKVIILGNAGSGKSTELQKLAVNSWTDGEQEGPVPILVNLRNFTSLDTLDTFLPAGYKDLNHRLFIFDGIDEITDVEDFKSKFESFIVKETQNQGKGKNKYILSCRTNIYESIVYTIPGFDSYFIRDLTYDESILYLKKKCGEIVDDLDFSPFSVFLKNPFQLDLIAVYLNDNKALPSSQTDMWDTYITRRLSVDKKGKLVKSNFNPASIKSNSNKVALINELMKETTINEDNLYATLLRKSNEFEEFKRNPLVSLTSSASGNSWFFEHKNIQEFFAARSISELDINGIISFIQIDSSGKTHPSLFNTITFLLNLVSNDPQKQDQLTTWFIENEPEILFKSDDNGVIEATRARVFQSYFQHECIDNTFWLTTNQPFSMKEIAGFSNCTPNFLYLLGIVKGDYQRRVIQSAINLLGFFTVPSEHESELMDLFFEILKSEDNEIDVKTQVIYAMIQLKIIPVKEKFHRDIFEIFDNESNKQLNTALLTSLLESENLDHYFPYLLCEFKRAHGILSRNDNDKVIRGNSTLVQCKTSAKSGQLR